MSDAVFLRSLRSFITVPENWNKLRLFMLRAGWPEESLRDYRDASEPQEQLVAAQKPITHMLAKNNHHRK